MEIDKEKIKLCLKIIAGIQPGTLSNSEYTVLGFDPYKFGYCGSPDTHDLKMDAIEYITDTFIYLSHSKTSVLF